MQNSKVLFFKPYLSPRVWGGDNLKALYNQTQASDPIGEAWLLSAVPGKESICVSQGYEDLTLTQVLEQNRQMFGDWTKPYPHLIKFIDAKDDLSVQVHPDDVYAQQHHDCLGKTECWYFLKTKSDQKIVMGHAATSKSQLVDMIEQKDWKNLLTCIDVKKGDFIYVPAGSVHAITADAFVCEIQQSSDITYRLYDYDRKGLDGQPRELHLKQAIDVIKCPQTWENLQKEAKGDATHLVNNDLFKIIKIDTTKQQELHLSNPLWTEVICISGKGKINNEAFQMGTAAIFTHGTAKLNFAGEMELLVLPVYN